ncbi:MAG TPA: PLD nuclease N-terminal domain-containing protein [Nocardiopsis listeri]|uniref:PLD nuclease N-terminal domain-containing protein n=1 Tax=Nocardiopsis listeri TaxID=53440 RepID=UPI001DEA9E58|nr:PLD nuclease N-terminal domain-containing protein [Nocardiopsis listeri]HJE59483.1 PLD nuclease N-terminal domain-containing protein [Nocardiopsis listeri]
MVYLALVATVLSLVFWVYVLFDVIGSESERVRLLPKTAWAVIVLLLPKIGPAAWFLLGRPPRDRKPVEGPMGSSSPFPEYDHPGRARASTAEEDEAFLRQCRERAEEQRARARELQAREERERLERRRGQREEGLEQGERGADEDPTEPAP